MRFSSRTICCAALLAVPLLASCTSATDKPAAETVVPISSPVPAPSGGSVTETVEPKPVEQTSAIPVGEEAQVKDKVRVKIEDVKAIDAKATIPGDVAGPAVQFKVSVVNETDTPVAVDNVVINVTGSDTKPAIMFEGPPTEAFVDEVKSGASASGIYAFRIAPEARKPVSIEVSVNPSLPVASFIGDLP